MACARIEDTEVDDYLKNAEIMRSRPPTTNGTDRIIARKHVK